MSKKYAFFVFSMVFFFFTAKAQVGIGTVNPHESAILDIESEDKGVLIPRLKKSERDAIASPSEGLVIYNTTTGTIEFSNGSQWVNLDDLSQTNITNSGTPTGNGGIIIGGNNSDPNSVLEVNSKSKGVLFPRLSNTQRNDINNPAEGLIIYNISINCFEYFDGNNWINLCL